MTDTKAYKAKNNESGTITQLLSAAEVTTAHLSPVPEQAPGVFVMAPGTSSEEHIYYREKDGVLGTVSGLIRDYENQNGGVGREHQANTSWETLQSVRPLNNIVDILQEGFQKEMNEVAYVSATSFTVRTNRSAFYTMGRVLRLEGTDIAIVDADSTYNAGTGLTTVVVVGTVTNPTTSVEFDLQPKGQTDIVSLRKATGASINAGIADDDIVTSKAIADSNVAFLADIPTVDVTASNTVTLTNKRITKRINTVASSATPSINVDTTDIFTITALAAAITSMTSGLSGTPTHGQMLVIRIKDNGTARAITWGASYRASSDLALPTTTVVNKTLYCGFVYNSTDSKWDLVAYLNNF